MVRAYLMVEEITPRIGGHLLAEGLEVPEVAHADREQRGGRVEGELSCNDPGVQFQSLKTTCENLMKMLALSPAQPRGNLCPPSPRRCTELVVLLKASSNTQVRDRRRGLSPRRCRRRPVNNSNRRLCSRFPQAGRSFPVRIMFYAVHLSAQSHLPPLDGYLIFTVCSNLTNGFSI